MAFSQAAWKRSGSGYWRRRTGRWRGGRHSGCGRGRMTSGTREPDQEWRHHRILCRPARACFDTVSLGCSTTSEIAMQTEEITIRVDTEAARAYRAASEQERRKLDLLLSLRLHDALHSSGSLQELMRDLSRKAQ